MRKTHGMKIYINLEKMDARTKQYNYIQLVRDKYFEGGIYVDIKTRGRACSARGLVSLT